MPQKDQALGNAIITASLFVGLLWIIKLYELWFAWDLVTLGVKPHSIQGLIGIVTAPLIHSNLAHLIANTLPILLLGSALIYGYPKSRWSALIIIWLSAGLGVWLFGRNSYHIGASGLSHGMFFFLLLSGILRRDKRSIGLLMIAFFMYGTMLLTIFPRDPAVSFESHFFGALGGSISALLFGMRDPKPAQKVYSWELEPVNEEDDIIGDLWKPEHERQQQEDPSTEDKS